MHDEQAQRLIHAITAFANAENAIRAAALVGSWARGAAHADSDLDFVLLAERPDDWRGSLAWIARIDFARADYEHVRSTFAPYGSVFSAHIELSPHAEVELTFADARWAIADPIDPGTAQAIGLGFRILVDKDGVLQRLSRTPRGGEASRH